MVVGMPRMVMGGTIEFSGVPRALVHHVVATLVTRARTWTLMDGQRGGGHVLLLDLV